MKKLLFLGFLSLAMYSCTNNVDSGALRSFVKDQLKDNQGTLILSNYKDADWDRVYILGPYTNKRMFDDRLKNYTKDILATGVDTETDICLLMLFKGDKMITQSIFDRKSIDFNNLIKIGTGMIIMPYAKGNTSFSYNKKAKYDPYIISLKR